MIGGRAFGFALMLLGVSGCSLLVSLDGLSGGSSDSSDASPESDAAVLDGKSGGDAVSSSDAESGTVDAGPNLITNGDFEESASSCAEWFTFNATATIDPIAHSGKSSCRVCLTGNASSGFALDHGTILPTIAASSSFTATAWLRATPSNTDPAQHAAVIFRVYGDPNAAPLQQGASPDQALTQTWVQATATLTANSAGTLNFFMPATQTVDGSCYLVDDVVAVENH